LVAKFRIQRDVEEALLSAEIDRCIFARWCAGRTILVEVRRRPVFSVMRKRPLGRERDGPG